MHLVSLAAVTWDFKLVGRTRMLTEAWLRAGQPTTFVQVPSYRTAAERLTGLLRPADAAPVVRPWPIYPARWWARLSRARLERGIRARARGLRRQLEGRVRWEQAAALVVSPLWTPWLEELPFRHVIYDCIDDLAVPVPRPELAGLYQQWEDELIARADGAVVVAEQLAARIRARRPGLPMAVIRNGGDADGFRSAAAAALRPRDLPDSGRPIIGFVGALYDWLDWELLRVVLQALPDCEFVFVGPHDNRGDIRAIANLPNAHLLGLRAYAEVPAYVQAFDVCWVPFKAGDVANAANPVKIYEYLALGKPVVTTPVADTASFGDLVSVARTPAEVADCLRAALTRRAPDSAKRQAFAAANSWSARAAAYVKFVSHRSAQAQPSESAACGSCHLRPRMSEKQNPQRTDLP
jgi:glycosyltransferase involved in cell wall biosynthesis